MPFDWTEVPLANTPWRIQIVADILPILIRRAKQGREITYGELAQELSTEFGHVPKGRKTLYGPPVGAVAQAIQRLGERWSGERIPPINTIVVDARTRLPSTGADEVAHYFFRDGGAGMTDDREAYLRQAMTAVYDYGTRWDRVAEALDAKSLPSDGAYSAQGEPIPLPHSGGQGGPESEQHRNLKLWVAKQPTFFSDFGSFESGRNEYPLSSGDRLDAHFESQSCRLAVEVKASNASDDELMRGVYQCVKYRAVMRAEQQAMCRAPNASAVLVSTRPAPKRLRDLSRRLLVTYLHAPIGAEEHQV